ncbi:MAG TPA: sensor domain-containing protein [Candidatus Edwardsbacteria bacterium]|nr:sensor domain-containing protein [Candidatus Edwardsbacteria bacterium]
MGTMLAQLGHAVKRVFGVPFRGETYRNLAYLALAFPLGLFYFIFLVTGLALGFGLYLVVIGLPLLVAVFLCWRLFIRFERLQSRWLLGQPTCADAALPWSRAGRLWPWLKSRLASPVSWKGFAFLLLKFPLGLASFVVLTAFGALTIALVAAPLLYSRLPYEVFDTAITSAGQAWLLAAAGLVLGVLSFHLFNALARLFRWLSAKLLGAAAAPAAPVAPAALAAA